MASVGDCFEYSVAEAFLSSLQRELLDQHHWTSRAQLATAIFEWIECWYNRLRRHSSRDGSILSTIRPAPWHYHLNQPVRQNGVTSKLRQGSPVEFVVGARTGLQERAGDA
jgi:transposase InsO family protein